MIAQSAAGILQQNPCLSSLSRLQIPAPILPNFTFSAPSSRRISNTVLQCISPTTTTCSAAAGVFPGGTRRATLRLPGLGLKLKTDEILQSSESVKSMLDSAVAAGLNLVILEDGKEDSLRVYDAARLVMSVLRGRADLLVAERVDVAAAAGANGVVLSDRGLPSVVARRMMQNAMPEAVVLPLVARRVSSSKSAENATITEGADLLLLEIQNSASSSVESLVESICARIKIPVFLEPSSSASSQELSVDSPVVKLIKLGANGMILDTIPSAERVSSFVEALASSTASPSSESRSSSKVSVNGEAPSRPVSKLQADRKNSLEDQAKLIIEEERIVLESAVEVIRAASPQMEEVELLIDAIKQLDDLFLLVVVGEFNSGKSSVINALLGDEFLKQGVLPTTNEITLLRFSDESYEERPDRHPDGHLMRYLAAELLKQMNLVDTPGTNVILQRQQRLTEEFVPRADLVLFVIGAERPLTESEVSFLRYIRRWDKKIIFALNKCDLLAKESEVEEVMRFVKDNVRQLLNIDEALIYPISARSALGAKLKAKNNTETIDRDPVWKKSGFDKLERYVIDFLGGSSDAGAERIRLKLDTPLGIAMALFSACQKKLQADAARVEGDRRALEQVQEQLHRYKELMTNNADIQTERVNASVSGATARAMEFIDRSLQITSVDTASKYLLSRKPGVDGDSSEFENEIIGSAATDVKRAIEDHRCWLATNNEREIERYQEIGRSRWPDTHTPSVRVPELSSRSLEALNAFDVKAANVLLENELRDVVFSTFGSLGIAGASASFLTSVLPSTLEDSIALALCSAGGLASIFKLPSLRQNVKSKVKGVADSLAQSLQEAMNTDLADSIQSLDDSVQQLLAPYRSAVEEEAARVESIQQQLLLADDQLQILRQKIQNLGSTF